MSEQNLKYVKSLLVFRHGARGPSKPAFDTFGTNDAVKNSWKLPNGEYFIDQLSPEGIQMCETLGKWMRKYLQENHSTFEKTEAEKVKWRTSRIKRVKDSGKEFWKGFDESVEVNDLPYEGSAADEHFADTYFRTWVSNGEYKKWADGLIKSPSFVAKGQEAAKQLDEIVDVLSLTPFKKYPKSAVLYGMTFAREMVDCERYYGNIKDKPLESLLSKEQLATIDELSLWCWDQRFFTHAEYKKQLGENLVGEIVGDMLDDTHLFNLYSGHDYTILVILAALGIPHYPELLSFGAYLLFEVYDKTNSDGSTERVFTMTLNPTPFEENQKPTEDIQSSHGVLVKNANGESYWPVRKP